MHRTFFIFSFLVLFHLIGNAQSLTSNNNKAIKFYNEGNQLAHNRAYNDAIKHYLQSIKKDPSFAEAYLKLGSLYHTLGQKDIAHRQFQKVAALYPDSRRFSGVYFTLGDYEFYKGNYNMADKYLTVYLKYKKTKDKYRIKAEKLLENCNYALNNMERGYEFNPRPLDSTINRFGQQYFPVLTADQNTLFFIRRTKDEDIMIAQRLPSDKWSMPQPIPGITSQFNEGTCSISADGRMLVFTSCMGRKGEGSCDLYVTYKVGDVWSLAQNLGPLVNTSAWESQPSLSADGRILYFVSNRSDGFGKRDIWMTSMLSDDTWDKPVNAGKMINTTGDDISPFIHPNNQRLYFASASRAGFGGFDIYFSDKGENSGWTQAINFGYPINTQADEVSMYISADGKNGYYSHETIENNKKISLLYQIDIPDVLQIKHHSGFVTGTVREAETNKPLQADILLINLDNEEVIGKVASDSVSGNYLMVITQGAAYALYVKKRGYLFNSYHFDFINRTDVADSVEADIVLSPVRDGASTILQNLFFEFDKYFLDERSQSELDIMTQFLESYPEIKVEIGGYTDNIGSAGYNQQLSENRAKAVYEYLMKNGIPTNQITYRGYGNAFPLNNNLSEQERSINRRIEFTILNK